LNPAKSSLWATKKLASHRNRHYCEELKVGICPTLDNVKRQLQNTIDDITKYSTCTWL